MRKGSLLQLVTSHCSAGSPGLQKTLQLYITSPVEAKELLKLFQAGICRRVLRVTLWEVWNCVNALTANMPARLVVKIVLW